MLYCRRIPSASSAQNHGLVDEGGLLPDVQNRYEETDYRF
jgi:hypothetical protein